MPTVLCLKAYFVKSDLAMYDEDQVAAASQIIRTRRPMFRCCIIEWIVWHSSSINTGFSYNYLKHPGHMILSIGSRQRGKNEHESCAKTLIQNRLPGGCQVWLSIPSLLSLVFLQQSCLSAKWPIVKKTVVLEAFISHDEYIYNRFILQPFCVNSCCQGCPAAVRSTNLCPLDKLLLLFLPVFKRVASWAATGDLLIETACRILNVTKEQQLFVVPCFTMFYHVDLRCFILEKQNTHISVGPNISKVNRCWQLVS